MTVEQLLNSVKTVVDYDMISNGTVFAVIRSEKGHCTIRQSLRNGDGGQQGFKVIKKLGNVDDELAKLELAELISQAEEARKRIWR